MEEPAAPEKTVKTPPKKQEHDQFWKMFWGLYCHPSKLSISAAHHYAARMARNNWLSAVPTYRQAVRAVQKENQAAIAKSREG
jgi:hypothetical protein